MHPGQLIGIEDSSTILCQATGSFSKHGYCLETCMESAYGKSGGLWIDENTAGRGWEICGFGKKVSTQPGTPTGPGFSFMAEELFR